MVRQQGWLEIDHGDLWERGDANYRAHREGDVLVVKVQGHTKWTDVAKGQVLEIDMRGDDMADLLACAGADQHDGRA